MTVKENISKKIPEKFITIASGGRASYLVLKKKVKMQLRILLKIRLSVAYFRAPSAFIMIPVPAAIVEHMNIRGPNIL